MEINIYLRIFQRWFWLIILGGVLGACAGYFIANSQEPVYQAQTKFMVISSPDQQANDYTGNLDQQLATTYIQLLTTQPVLDSVGKQVNYPVYAGQINGQLIRDTQIIRATVEDPNPKHAAEIANALISVLVEQNDLIQANRFAASEESLKAQLTQIEKQITDQQAQISQVSDATLKEQRTKVNDQIKDLQSQIMSVQRDITAINPTGQATLSPDQINLQKEKNLRLERLQSTLDFYQGIYLNLLNSNPLSTSSNGSVDLDQLKNTLAHYQDIYGNLLNSYESIRLARLRSTPNVVQVEQANIPVAPIRPQPISSAMTGGIIGMLLACMAIFLLEYMDTTVKSPEEISHLVDLPVIGYMQEIKAAKDGKEHIYVMEEPRSPFTESMRSLRTNLEFSEIDNPLQIILVTSPNPGEGKTTIAVNLASVIAQSGKRVVILDGDLRRPKIHRFLGVNNRIGLSDVFLNHRTIQAIARPWKDTTLSVITSGSLPPNPTEILASEKMRGLLQNLRDLYEIIVVDSPPILVSDAAILASRADGVLVVMNPGKTDKNSAKATVQQLRRVNARLLGIVFNRIPQSRSEYYGGYHHYSRYYSYYSAEKPEDEAKMAKKQGKTPVIDEPQMIIDETPIMDIEQTQPIRKT